MIRDSSNLQKGQLLRVEINEVKDRLPKKILEKIKNEPVVELVGYKMVDGNQFGLVVKFRNGVIRTMTPHIWLSERIPWVGIKILRALTLLH